MNEELKKSVDKILEDMQKISANTKAMHTQKTVPVCVGSKIKIGADLYTIISFDYENKVFVCADLSIIENKLTGN